MARSFRFTEMQGQCASRKQDKSFGVGHRACHHDPRCHQENQSGGSIFLTQQAGRVDCQNRAQHLGGQARDIMGSSRQGMQMKEGTLGPAGQARVSVGGEGTHPTQRPPIGWQREVIRQHVVPAELGIPEPARRHKCSSCQHGQRQHPSPFHLWPTQIGWSRPAISQKSEGQQSPSGCEVHQSQSAKALVQKDQSNHTHHWAHVRRTRQQPVPVAPRGHPPQPSQPNRREGPQQTAANLDGPTQPQQGRDQRQRAQDGQD